MQWLFTTIVNQYTKFIKKMQLKNNIEKLLLLLLKMRFDV